MTYHILSLTDHPEMMPQMAHWFHEKWGIPLDAYLDSMNECLNSKSAVPRWYVALCDREIVGGVGVIENDFHDRPDLTPNVRALYVEETHLFEIGAIKVGVIAYCFESVATFVVPQMCIRQFANATTVEHYDK